MSDTSPENNGMEKPAENSATVQDKGTPQKPGVLPEWAKEMSEIFRSGAVSQFILYGNVADWVQYTPPGSDEPQFVSLQEFLCKGLFAPFEVVLSYDRGKGVRSLKGGELLQQFLKVFDGFHHTGYTSGNLTPANDPGKVLELGNALPKDPKRALEIVDRFIRNGLFRTKPGPDGKPVPDPMRVALIIDYAQFLIPRTDPGYTSAEIVETLIKILDWASDPMIGKAMVVTCLIAETLADLSKQVVENPRSAKLRIDLPNAAEVRDFIGSITADIADFSSVCDVDRESLSQKLEGLSRVDLQNLIRRAVKNRQRISMEYLRSVKKELIEKSAGGRMEFVESTKTLDHVAGHVAVKQWLRQDALLMKRGKLKALPMGYLITGRIGTGKTYLVECFAGECGIPCVELKNFRDKWVGASEGNLEAIFKILHAMGQVIVFVDEADQWAGKRSSEGGDSGLSGRLYAMLAREMADTRNRGRIFWMFATSRPDLLEIDLKRVGRLDVHIPLFSPQTAEERKELFAALAKKNKVKLAEEDYPTFPDDLDIGGNEMEGILIRASRLYELQEDTPDKKPIGSFIRDVMKGYKPMAHTERLEYMDLVATLECTDERFLPEKFAKIPLDQIEQRMAILKGSLGEG